MTAGGEASAALLPALVVSAVGGCALSLAEKLEHGGRAGGHR
ncbi:MAG TPA: hypothetical protein VGP30_01410 [Candidatus Limnocylindrales bacterium]|nr:hypothetical protein [Candidatus Limnocylindrales bacterium]